MDVLITLGTLFGISWFISSFELLEEGLGSLAEAAQPKYLKIGLIKLYNLVTCHKCLGFWLTLIYTQNILFACIIGIAAELYGIIKPRD